MKKSPINEIFFLRGISCLAVVLVHSLNVSAINYQDNMSGISNMLIGILRMAALFGTPTFIFISEFLLAKSYSDRIPPNFIGKRVKLILFPYVSMALFYAAFEFFKNDLNFWNETIKNVFLAGYHGYFIVIIFQFYFLHIFFVKHINKYSPKIVILVSFIINAAYLGFFNFVKPFDFPYATYIWERLSWLPFLGWIFYFSLAFYAGKYRDTFKKLLYRHSKKLIILPVFALLIVVIMRYLNLPDISSSKRLDMIFYTTSMIFLIVYLSSFFKTPPRILVFISQYSFGIYLLHPFFQLMLPYNSALNVWLYIVIAFIIGVAMPVITTYILNKFTFGKYIVGKIGPGFNHEMKKNTPKKNAQVAK